MVSSFEKSMSQFYIRRHLVGSGQGRAMGVNAGGLVEMGRSVSLLYNVGAFNPQTTGFWNQAARANTAGLQPSWVYAARAVLQLGQSEINRYALAYTVNYFNERRGLSLGANASHQGRTDLFAASTAYGVDFLLNYAGLNFDGEYLHMQRRNAADEAYATQTGHLRVGYNLILRGKYFLEPTAMVMRFDGATDPEGQLRAASVAFLSGTDRTYDVGVNWYLDHNFLKVTLHYTWRRGELGNNQLFGQEDIGLIQRGDWAGLGFSAIF